MSAAAATTGVSVTDVPGWMTACVVERNLQRSACFGGVAEGIAPIHECMVSVERCLVVI